MGGYFCVSKRQTWGLASDSNAEDLQSLISRYLAFFENDYAILNDPAGYFQTAYALWQKILPPETESAFVLTILPDGMLNFAAF